ncbi:MAG: CBASS oligonucleotide cyclase [Chloroflexota bacterium]
MGGSGGHNYGYIPKTPRQIDELVEQAEADTQDRASSTDIERIIDDKLSEINDHDYEAIDRHRTQIENKLSETYEGVESVQYGGSHSRHTDVSGLSDIDILAPMGQVADTPASSKQAIERLADVLRERYPNSKIETGHMAVTVHFSDGIEIQVLPAFKVGSDRFKIPDPNSTGWVETCPTAFAKKLTDANRQYNNLVVPIIKVAKYLCDAHNVPVSSYHLENMIVESLSHYSGRLNQHEMLQHVINQAKSQVLHRVPDPCGQSNDAAGALSPTERITLASRFRSLEQKIVHANAVGSSDEWETLLN